MHNQHGNKLYCFGSHNFRMSFALYYYGCRKTFRGISRHKSLQIRRVVKKPAAEEGARSLRETERVFSHIPDNTIFIVYESQNGYDKDHVLHIDKSGAWAAILSTKYARAAYEQATDGEHENGLRPGLYAERRVELRLPSLL